MSDAIIAEKSEIKPCFVPPSLITRNEHGLINNGSVNYIFTTDGRVDWRKMINPAFLVPHKQAFERRKQEVPKTIEGLEDKDLLILLGGIKELAQIRGYESVRYNIVAPNDQYVVATCSINWIPNYETEGRDVTFSAIADASPFNTNSFGKNYLGPIAENRAFVRAVRNFLRINIVSQEEINSNSPAPEPEQQDVSGDLLLNTMKEHDVSFAKIKETLIKDGMDGAEKFTSVSDIPKFKQFELVERIKKAFKKKSS